MSDEKKLRALISEIYEKCSDDVRISPSWLATQAMVELDSNKQSPPLVYIAAHLQLRQISRGICRGKFEDGETESHDLFPDLQKRYPVSHDAESEPEYVLLEHLTEEDIRYNINRLRKEADTKQRHADALDAWWQTRVAA